MEIKSPVDCTRQIIYEIGLGTVNWTELNRMPGTVEWTRLKEAKKKGFTGVKGSLVGLVYCKGLEGGQDCGLQVKRK